MIRTSLLLSSMLLSSVAFADCQVPESLTGMTFVNVVDPIYSQQNPNAGAIAKVSYSAEEYLTEFLNREIGPFKGKYRYKVLDKDNGIGLYLGDESLPENKPTHTVLFKCLTNKRGLAIFTQRVGQNESVGRQNSLVYTIESHR